MAKVNSEEDRMREVRINDIMWEVHNVVSAIRLKYDREEGNEAFKRYIKINHITLFGE